MGAGGGGAGAAVRGGRGGSGRGGGRFTGAGCELLADDEALALGAALGSVDMVGSALGAIDAVTSTAVNGSLPTPAPRAGDSSSPRSITKKIAAVMTPAAPAMANHGLARSKRVVATVSVAAHAPCVSG